MKKIIKKTKYHEKTEKIVRKPKTNCEKMKKKLENIIWKMSIRRLVFGIHLSEFVRVGKNNICDISIWGNTFEVLTVKCEPLSL